MMAKNYSRASINVHEGVPANNVDIVNHTQKLFDFFGSRFPLPYRLSIFVRKLSFLQDVGIYYPDCSTIGAAWGSHEDYKKFGGASATSAMSRFKLCFERTLFHELMHASQYASGRMSHDYFSNIIIWEGKSFPRIVPERMSYEDYLNLPWEKEAFEKSVQLHEEYEKIMLDEKV